ncbi:hypothetical protein [Sphingomonas sp. DBB INV C78]|uniref:hypothetical protein n=1 Tax=Sphingomonas sp. DBB INV C78 TaxID=3349434 RepID=UPI0036D25EA5
MANRPHFNRNLHQFFQQELSRLDTLAKRVGQDGRMAQRMRRLRARAAEDFLDLVCASAPSTCR